MVQRNKLYSVSDARPKPRDGAASPHNVVAGPDELLRFAQVDRSLPPAVMPPPADRKPVIINMKAFERTARAITAAAVAGGTTQKMVIMRALAAAGIELDPRDLVDRTPRRRARE